MKGCGMKYRKTERRSMKYPLKLKLSGVRKNGRKKSFEAIERLRTRGYSVKLLCRIAHVSRTGYYRYVQATHKPTRDALPAEKVRQVQKEVRYSYGAKRMAHALSKHAQEQINHKRIAKIMREYLVGARIRLRRHPEYWYRQRHTVRLSDRQCAPNILITRQPSTL